MERRIERGFAKGMGVSILVCALTGLAGGQATIRASVDSAGAQANAISGDPSISADGRYLAFTSDATNLVAGDTNGKKDIFVHDRQTLVTSRVSVSSSGMEADGNCDHPSISADGRYVAFDSNATTLVTGDTNATYDIFVRDLLSGTTERVSVDSGGIQGNDRSRDPSISGDGRFVAFDSIATNLISGDSNGLDDVFVHDRQSGTTERVSVDWNGGEVSGECAGPAISADGRCVAFQTWYSLVPQDTNAGQDVYLRDRQSATTEIVSVHTSGAMGNNVSHGPLSVSGDGRYVSFVSFATTLVNGDTNGAYDAFVRDRQAGTTERVSLSSSGAQGNGQSYGKTSLSLDGRWVAFESESTNLVTADSNGARDVFVRDLETGVTQRVSVPAASPEANGISNLASLSGDGRFVAFPSGATNLVVGDTNNVPDVFIRDRQGTGITSICDPGVSGVIGCPCSNPATASGRGCDNSSGTGGAALSAAGIPSVSSDSLIFTSSSEKPTALSILSQWTGTNATGTIFGMGVRCTSGSLKRLYTKAAVGGSIAAPDIGAGDAPVTLRSAQIGDTILGGQFRWYFVYYRDPIVLGGCPSTSTFNATQTMQVPWSP